MTDDEIPVAARYTSTPIPGHRSAHDVIVERLAAGERVLELGTAGGTLSRAMQAVGCRVFGVEIDPEAAALASRYCEQVLIADLEKIDLVEKLGRGQFDVVVAADILEHVRDPARLLRATARTIAPGGRLIASIPNVAHGSVRLALLQGEFRYTDIGLLDRTHLRFFTRASAEELLHASGFRVQERDRVVIAVGAAGSAHFDERTVPHNVMDMLNADRDIDTFQFVFVAEPEARAVPEVRREVPIAPADLTRAQASVIASQQERIDQLSAALAAVHRPMGRRVRSMLGRVRRRLR